jgi:DMSO reductase anchor subunit
MHPAFSVIFFTTASGAGYGMLIVFSACVLAGALPQNFTLAVTGMVLALGLVTAGLLSSTFHLGHPERAWRAFSQWRTSWLSREGIAAVVAYIPALAFGVAWAVPKLELPISLFAGLTFVCAFTTLFTTAMIYRSLKPILAWHNKWVVPSYLVLGPMSGAVIVLALTSAFGAVPKYLAALTGMLLASGLTVKWLYWSFIDDTPSPITPASATGLVGTGANVSVRSVEWPHTEANYVMKEMGFAIARKHGQKLRLIAIWLGFLLPGIMIETAILVPVVFQPFFVIPATALMAVGLIVERWLFFAQAKHAVTLYYGAPAV